MIHVDTIACDACGTCVGVCPYDALVLERTVTVNTDRCTGCGTCVLVCPFGALTDVASATAAKGAVS